MTSRTALKRLDEPSAPDGVGASDRAAAAELRHAFRGELVRPSDRGYATHRRIWNGAIDRRPTVIARCVGVSDVMAAIRFGRRTQLPIAVRSGGHSFPGFSVCDDGIVIDLRQIRNVAIDRDTHRVRVEAGALLGELDAATLAHGMAVPVGAISHTGIAGLTLGGGIGWLMRKHGLTIDRLRSATLVSADGTVLKANDEENADLFWALRGGGGNFGIVTDFEFEMAPIPPVVVGGAIYWPLEDAPAVSRFYRDWSAAVPDDMTTALVFRRAPATAAIPSILHGRPVVAVICCWSGAPEIGERILEPLTRLGRPLLQCVDRRPFLRQQSMLDASYPHGLFAYVRACNVGRLDDAVLDLAIDHAHRIRSGSSSVTIWQLGGAVARVDPDETAFGGRSSGHVVNVSGATASVEGFESEAVWARDLGAALQPHQSGVYVNFLMDEGEQRVRHAYGAQRYARLVAVKRRYDPDNVFRLNQNIRPA